MADPNDNSSSLHTVDIEEMGADASEVQAGDFPGDDLCTVCWAMFDGTDLPTCPSCGELVSCEGWASLPYRFLDRYEFLEPLGRGGVGAVFRARHVDESRGEQQFAVKVVQQGTRPERRKLLARIFEREISAAALVGRSRHFVRVLGHDTGDHLHLAMEYIPWPTLKARLRCGELFGPIDVAKLGIALLRALEVMHAHNLVHRDLKPANIFVTDEDGELRIKIADLGLWILSEDRRGDVTESLPAGAFAGTLDYASPEQMEGVDIGLRSDLHAVGSVLWAAATGDVPFPAMGASFLSSLKFRRQLVEAVPARPAELPEALFLVIAKALRPRVEDRFASAKEFADALEQLVQDSEAFEPTTHVRVGSTGRKYDQGDPTLSPVEDSRSGGKKTVSRWPLWAGGAGMILVSGYVAVSAFVKVASEGEALGAPTSAAPSIPSASPAVEAPVFGPRLRSLLVGHRHTCALLGDGIACWGANERGQLGDGTMTSRSRPVRVAGVGDVVEIGLGQDHSCARAADGSVWCWGSDVDGELGDGSTTSRAAPMRVEGVPAVARLFVHGCGAWAWTDAGQGWEWGCASAGRGESGMPRRFSEIDGARSAHGWEQGLEGARCAVFDDRSPWCLRWGKGIEEVHGEALSALGPVVELALARTHGCARLADGSARCWGTNGSGEVGDGTRERRAVAVDVANARNLEQVVVGPEVGCARTKEGRVLCWGRSDRGQTAGGPENQLVPLEIPAVNGVTHIATDQGRTCAVVEDGGVACWGPGISQPGKGVVWMDGMKGSGSITASGGGVVCSTLTDGGAACFGDDEFGQLGIGRSLQRFDPAPVNTLAGVEGVWAAARNACAVDDRRRLWCWGHTTWGAFDAAQGVISKPTVVGMGVREVAMGARGLYALVQDEEGVTSVRAGGQLISDHGIGPSARHAYPQSVLGLDRATQIAVGVRHGCARMADGSVLCWGDNSYGQLGEGSASSRARPAPALIEGEVEQVASGGYHSCALRKTGGVVCWGSNRNGQTGPGPTWTCKAGKNLYPCVRRPRRVIGVQDAVALAAGQWHTCVLTKAGGVSCWGANASGQLGDGTTDERSFPKLVRDISNAVGIGVGERHACAVLRDGAVWCWGDNRYGELGRSTKDTCGSANEPCGKVAGPVVGLGEVVQVATGWEFTCALRRDGTVLCWGSNQRGTLGDGVPLVRMDAQRVQW